MPKNKLLEWIMIAPCSVALAYPNLAGATDQGMGIVGTWLNPRHSIVVHTDENANTLSGKIVWASDEARADARDSGVSSLIGLELLEDYHPDGRGRWRGTVYVPDMGQRFTSFISQPRPDQLKISGCILGGLICKSQLWRRQL